jgi:hypothetical protein
LQPGIRFPLSSYKSWAKPHVVNYQGHWRFYARNSVGKYPLDVLELKSAFLATTALGERIRDFHFDRISKIESNETPLLLADKARVILHTIPATLRPIFDAVWNLAGWQKSLGYNEEGEWGKGPNFLC